MRQMTWITVAGRFYFPPSIYNISSTSSSPHPHSYPLHIYPKYWCKSKIGTDSQFPALLLHECVHMFIKWFGRVSTHLLVFTVTNFFFFFGDDSGLDNKTQKLTFKFTDIIFKRYTCFMSNTTTHTHCQRVNKSNSI